MKVVFNHSVITRCHSDSYTILLDCGEADAVCSRLLLAWRARLRGLQALWSLMAAAHLPEPNPNPLTPCCLRCVKIGLGRTSFYLQFQGEPAQESTSVLWIT